jgi:hypothetical protein
MDPYPFGRESKKKIHGKIILTMIIFHLMVYNLSYSRKYFLCPLQTKFFFVSSPFSKGGLRGIFE